MSDALLTRIAEALEKLVHHHIGANNQVAGSEPAAEPAKRGRPQKAQATAPAADTFVPPVAAPVASITTSSASAAPAQVAPAPAATPPAELVTQTANAVIDLANNYSRDAAVACMAKYGAQKVSQVKASDLGALLADVTAAIAAEKAKKASESLV